MTLSFKMIGCNSSLSDKIKIMTAVLDGIPVQYRDTSVIGTRWDDVGGSDRQWNWKDENIIYRIKPKESKEYHLYVSTVNRTKIIACLKEDDRTIDHGSEYELIKVREILEDDN